MKYLQVGKIISFGGDYVFKKKKYYMIILGAWQTAADMVIFTNVTTTTLGGVISKKSDISFLFSAQLLLLGKGEVKHEICRENIYQMSIEIRSRFE